MTLPALIRTMLEEALGGDRAYFHRHGYHADILRDSILQTRPRGWHERLGAIPDCPSAQAIDPHDLAAVKLLGMQDKNTRGAALMTQGGAERVRSRGWSADFQPIGHCHRHFIHTANTFRRSVTFLACTQLLAGRPKDLALVREIVQLNLIHLELLRGWLQQLDIPVELRPRFITNFNNL